ncbi:MAG: hypothetical protein AAF533_19665 [Acidobacteriota bacterium]
MNALMIGLIFLMMGSVQSWRTQPPGDSALQEPPRETLGGFGARLLAAAEDRTARARIFREADEAGFAPKQVVGAQGLGAELVVAKEREQLRRLARSEPGDLLWLSRQLLMPSTRSAIYERFRAAKDSEQASRHLRLLRDDTPSANAAFLVNLLVDGAIEMRHRRVVVTVLRGSVRWLAPEDVRRLLAVVANLETDRGLREGIAEMLCAGLHEDRHSEELKLAARMLLRPELDYPLRSLDACVSHRVGREIRDGVRERYPEFATDTSLPVRDRKWALNRHLKSDPVKNWDWFIAQLEHADPEMRAWIVDWIRTAGIEAIVMADPERASERLERLLIALETAGRDLNSSSERKPVNEAVERVRSLRLRIERHLAAKRRLRARQHESAR